jgi:hypothetical protein
MLWAGYMIAGTNARGTDEVLLLPYSRRRCYWGAKNNRPGRALSGKAAGSAANPSKQRLIVQHTPGTDRNFGGAQEQSLVMNWQMRNQTGDLILLAIRSIAM